MFMKYQVTLSMIVITTVLILGFKKTDLKQSSPAANYQQYCAQCHGTDFQGGNAQSLMDGIWQFGEGENYIFRNIKFGIQHLGMPSYESSLTDNEIRELVDYIKETAEDQGVTRPPMPNELETLDYKISLEDFATDVRIPWSIDFVDENKAFITEKPGQLRIVENGKLLSDPVSGIPEVLFAGQGGLMDVALHPDYNDNGWVYLAYSHEIEGTGDERRAPAMTRIVRGRVENNEWIDEEVIYEAPHESYRTTRHHYGCRIVFDPEGYMYFAIGDRGRQNQAQDLSLPNGKIHRVFPDGRIPEDNPFYDQQNALPTIYTYGNRNPQGLAVHPETGEVWETEHGPMGGDELNLIKAGVNYGWPVITYGRNYNGTIITDIVRKEGMAQPNLYWKPSIAVCGLDFYKGELFPKWNNKLLVGALKYEEVQLLNIADERVMHSETILKNAGRVRDVATGPDGAIYVVLNNPDKVIRILPRE
jgi:glucose/arabinose dehydrogenase